MNLRLLLFYFNIFIHELPNFGIYKKRNNNEFFFNLQLL